MAEAAATEPTVDESSMDAMFDASKKKKKKKPTRLFEEDGAAGEVAAPADAVAAGSAAPSAAAEGGAVAASESSAAAAHDAAGAGAAAPARASSSGSGSGDPFDYDDMLAKLYSTLHAHNPALSGGRKRVRVPAPEVARVGSTRVAWTNFKEIAAKVKRSQEHLQSFFLAELGTTGAIDGSERFLIRGRYLPRVLENLLSRYIVEYVQCNMCSSLETDLHRDADTRLYFLNCRSCGSGRSVAAIKAGYHATGRGERRKARLAAQ